MKTTIDYKGEKVEIVLTPEQEKEFKEKVDFRKIQTVEQAFEYLGINYQEWLEKRKDLEPSEIAYGQLIHIAKAINGNEWMDYNETDVYKYYPYFNASSSSVGFSYKGCRYVNSSSNVGSRLCFKSSERAIYAGKQFINIYNQYIN